MKLKHLTSAAMMGASWLLAGIKSTEADISLGTRPGAAFVAELGAVPNDAPAAGAAASKGRVWTVRVPPHAGPIQFSVAIVPRGRALGCADRHCDLAREGPHHCLPKLLTFE